MGKSKEKDTMEKDTREMGKAKATRGKEQESATTAARPDTCQEIAPNRNKKEKEREKASHFMVGATIATSKDTWREIAGAEKEE